MIGERLAESWRETIDETTQTTRRIDLADRRLDVSCVYRLSIPFRRLTKSLSSHDFRQASESIFKLTTTGGKAIDSSTQMIIAESAGRLCQSEFPWFRQ